MAKRWRSALRLAFLGAIVAAVVAVSSGATTGVTTMISVAIDGSPAGGSIDPGVSADDRYVAFVSDAANLVADDTACTPYDLSCRDLFLHDRETGVTTRIPDDGKGAAGSPALTPDGRFVAFMAGTYGAPGSFVVYVFDRQNGTLTPASVDDRGNVRNGREPSISSDGRYVAFESGASLVAQDTDGRSDVYVRDRAAGTTTLVETSQLPGFDPSISADGRYVAFVGCCRIFVWDRQSGVATAVTPVPGGDGGDFTPSITADGRLIAFATYTAVVAEDTNWRPDVYVLDRTLGTFERASVSSSEGQASGVSTAPSISADGRHVVFRSEATDLVPGDTNEVQDVFVRDRLAGVTTRVNVGRLGAEANGEGSSDPGISGDGESVVFNSAASNLVSGDAAGSYDVFVHERSFAQQGCRLSHRILFVAIPAGGTVALTRTGSALAATGDGISDQTCGGATVNNVDTIYVAGSDGAESFRVDLAGGPFAPGATAEDASSEIEIDVALGAGIDSLVVNGGPANEKLVLGELGLILNGDADVDVALAGVERVGLNGGSGNDSISGAGGPRAGKPWTNPLTLDGGAGKDTLTGGLAADTVGGGDGNDTFKALKSADGADTFDGGAGKDAVNYAPRGSGVRVSLDGAANDGSGNGAEGDDIGTDVENVTGSAAGDTIDDGGRVVANVFAAGGGNDTIDSVDGVGNDRLDGGAGTDTCTADAGDTIVNCP